MSSTTLPTTVLGASNAFAPKSLVHRLSLGLVWLAVASGAIVFSEPAPVDALTMALILGLPAVGLVALPRPVLIMFGFWLVAAAAAFIAACNAHDYDVATKHSAISVYLYFSALIFAGFVARQPEAHTNLILRAYTAGAMVAAIAGIAGYFALFPGAAELFTKYGRAAGPFKDPNVFGPFIIPALLYTFHTMFTHGRRGPWPIVRMGILLLAVLVSFSRGAWANLAVAVLIYAVLTFIVSRTNRERLGLILLALIGLAAMGLILVTALQFDKISKLMEERAQLTQKYDVGPQGRFGGQEKAIGLIADHPLGIGALEFAGRHHTEEVHNVYLSMYLNAGWLGGTIYLAIMIITVAYGLRQSFRRGPLQPLLIVAIAAFTGNVLEGVIVDVDHWRHLYLLMALVWALGAAASPAPLRIHTPLRPTRIAVPRNRTARILTECSQRSGTSYQNGSRRPARLRASHA